MEQLTWPSIRKHKEEEVWKEKGWRSERKAAERSEGAAPTLENGVGKSGLDLGEIEDDLLLYGDSVVQVFFRKHSCNTSWCPICGLKRLRLMLMEIFKAWDWKRVRTYVLTVDRELYTSPLEAYLEIQRSKELAEFMRRVKRGLREEGLRIGDYFWLLEWHKDGFGHWHFYVLVNKRGKAGRISKAVNLTEAWGRAKFVKEGYIESYDHWKNTMGYVVKHGYFGDGKKEQSVLPGWAKELQKEGPERIRIKRFERMRRNSRAIIEVGVKRDDRPVTMADIKRLIGAFDGRIYSPESGEFEKPYRKEEIRTWREVLESCGAKSYMTIEHKLFMLTVRIKFPYSEVKRMPGEYVEGKGYFVDLGVDRIMELIKLEDDLVYYSKKYEGYLNF